MENEKLTRGQLVFFIILLGGIVSMLACVFFTGGAVIGG
jgi:hypothetical protein